MRYFLILLILMGSCKQQAEKPEEPATEAEQINETPAVPEEPVYESEADHKLALLQGTWYSTEDSKSYLQVNDDQLLMGYEGVETGSDTYTMRIADQLPDGQPSNPDTQYLILTQGSETMNYAIDALTEESLKLLYLPRGTFLTYSRTK